MNPVIDGILTIEGGYTNNPNDSGGATNWGITEKTARAYGYHGEMEKLTRSEAYAILEQEYWLKPGFDLISKISWPVALELCDTAVNIGPHVSCIWLQRWLNVFNRMEKNYKDIKSDGVIGSVTLKALESFIKTRGSEGESIMIKSLNCSQGSYYLEITEAKPQNEDFIFGWIKNRIA